MANIASMNTRRKETLRAELDKQYNTDEIASNSTLSSDPEDNYEVQCILSERVWQYEDDDREETRYLLNWIGYPMHRCTMSPPNFKNYQDQGNSNRYIDMLHSVGPTWEPPENLTDCPIVLETWNKNKKLSSRSEFERFMEKNEEEHKAALMRAEVAKEVRVAKRQKKRRRRTKRVRPVVPTDGGDSGEDMPLRKHNRISSPGSSSGRSLGAREAVGPSQLGSLFVNDERSPTPGPAPPLEPERSNDRSPKKPRIVRNPPLQQSDSSSESSAADRDIESLDESLMEGLQGSTKNLMHEVIKDGPLQRNRRQPHGTHPKPKAPMKTISVASRPKHKLTTAPGDIIARRDGQTQQTLQSHVPPSTEKRSVVRAQEQTKALSSQRPPLNTSLTNGSDASVQRKGGSEAHSEQPSNTNRHDKDVLQRSATVSSTVAKNQQTSSRPTGPVKIVNRKEIARRSRWQTSDGLYNKLKFRGIAEKHSRREGTPDFAALDFIGAAPVGLSRPKARVPNDNPYGRRELNNRRFQVDSPGPVPRRQSVEDDVPMAEWEADKAPLVCSQWRLSNNCQYGAQRCHFLHRNRDALGQALPLGDPNGWVPPKYRKPPITCPFWLEDPKGCTKSSSECSCAHKNTGLKPHPDTRQTAPIPIDPNQKPASEHIKTPKRTCWWWTKGQCRYTDSECRYEHSDTGTMASTPAGKTCWYWAMGKCSKPDTKCFFKHYDTGIIAEPPPGALTCRLWAQGRCPKSVCGFAHHHVQYGLMSGVTQEELRRIATNPMMRATGDQPGQGHLQVAAPETDAGVMDVSCADNTAEMAIDPSRASPMMIPQKQSALPSASAPLVADLVPAQTTCSALKTKIESALHLDFTNMFTRGKGETNSSMLERRVFIAYHPQHHLEQLELLTRWLLMHHVEVSNTWYEGSWDRFVQQILQGGSGIVIVHPDFENFTELPRFGQVLRKEVRIWSVGLQNLKESAEPSSHSLAVRRFDCLEVFPLGGFIYMTDELFETKPQLALNIITLFLTRVEKLKQLIGPVASWQAATDGCLLWRLCVRPELMSHLFEHCEQRAKELDEGDPDVISRAELYRILSETDYIEQDEPVAPLSLVEDKFPILSERRIVAEEEPINYFTTLARSPEEANLRMMQYYAGLQVDLRRDYRHFFVVHSEPAAPYVQQWKDEMQTISEVMTPERCIEELEKDSSRSMFDFCERYMAECQTKT